MEKTICPETGKIVKWNRDLMVAREMYGKTICPGTGRIIKWESVQRVLHLCVAPHTTLPQRRCYRSITAQPGKAFVN